jgi:hypothetical protein
MIFGTLVCLSSPEYPCKMDHIHAVSAWIAPRRSPVRVRLAPLEPLQGGWFNVPTSGSAERRGA